MLSKWRLTLKGGPAMKKLFTAIRQGKLEEVAAILDKKPDLISCLAKAPPKKDDGHVSVIKYINKCIGVQR